MKINFQDNIILISHLKNGNENAFAYLVDCYNHNLCVYANSLINDFAMAEDIVQNVFIKTWKRRNNLRVNFSVKNFLYKSVYNEFIDQYRKHQSVMKLEKEYIDALNNITEENDEGSMEKLFNLVMVAIQDLPPKCKQTFILSKKDGFTNVEISEYMTVSIKTVEAQMTKAFSIIRKKCNREMENIFLD